MTAIWLGQPLTVSNSEIQTFKSCRRKWYLAYYREKGLKRSGARATGARELGTRVHIALQAMYGEGLNPVDVVNNVYQLDADALEAEGRAADIVELRKEQLMAVAMLEGYTDWLEETGSDEGIEVVAVETVIDVPSKVEGVRMRGKLDQRVVRKSDNARLFLDHKTVASLTEPAKILPMDEQMKFYHLLERLDSLYQTGNDEPPWHTDGGLYNMLRKVKRTAAAKPPFYGRLEVRHNRTEIQNMWVRVHKILEEIVETRQGLDVGADHQYVCPPRPSRDCTWSCDFFAMCSMMDDGSDWEGLLNEYYTHVDPHERYHEEDEGKVEAS